MVKIHFRIEVVGCSLPTRIPACVLRFGSAHCNEIIQEFCRVIERLICGATIAVADAPRRCFHEWANVFHNGSLIGLEWKVFLHWQLKRPPLERKTINKFQFRFSTASKV